MIKDTCIQIRNAIDLVSDTVGCIQNFSEKDWEEAVSGRLEADLKSVIESVNTELLESSKVCFCRLDDLAGNKMDPAYREELVRQCFCWLDKIPKILEKQYYAENVWDERFIRLMDRIQYVDFDMIMENVKDSLMNRKAAEIENLCKYYQRFQDMWGTLDVNNNRYDVAVNRVTVLKEHREDFIWLYNRLGDQRSRLALTSMLYNWLTFDTAYIMGMKEANYSDYFDLDLVKCDADEVIADLGAWTGDSALNYIRTYGKYKKIYCYEIDESSTEIMRKNLAEYPDIEIRNKGVGDKNSVGYLVKLSDSSCNKITEYNTGQKVEVVCLDEDIEEKITLIKMDIEGAEQDALRGSIRHIQEESPKLLVSVYHNNEDIWKIPRMITDMDSDYQLYLRSNGKQWGPAEIVLLAIHE